MYCNVPYYFMHMLCTRLHHVHVMRHMRVFYHIMSFVQCVTHHNDITDMSCTALHHMVFMSCLTIHQTIGLHGSVNLYNTWLEVRTNTDTVPWGLRHINHNDPGSSPAAHFSFSTTTFSLQSCITKQTIWDIYFFLAVAEIQLKTEQLQ